VPQVPVPPDVDEFLTRPNAAVIATLRSDGSPHSAATWYDWEDGRVLLNMDASRVRLGHMRRDPRVSLTVLDTNWYRHVSLQGRVVAIEPDAGLKDIDRLSNHYRGEDYKARDSARFSARIEVDTWHAWNV
jgi:PPOX class probable F420-dependent enzyme